MNKTLSILAIGAVLGMSSFTADAGKRHHGNKRCDSSPAVIQVTPSRRHHSNRIWTNGIGISISSPSLSITTVPSYRYIAPPPSVRIIDNGTWIGNCFCKYGGCSGPANECRGLRY